MHVAMTVSFSLVGIVLAIGIPTFQKALRPSKVSEAGVALQAMVRGAMAYYDATHELDGERRTQCLPPAAGPVPAEPDPHGATVNMAVYPEFASTFAALDFAPPTPTRYRYTFKPDVDGCDLGNRKPAVMVRFIAEGDLDDDDEFSRFVRSAQASQNGLEPDPLLVVENRLE